MFGRSKIKLCLPDKPSLLPRFVRLNRGRHAVSSLLEQVTRQMAPSHMTSTVFAHYPWSFAAPAPAIWPRHYVIGAFLPGTTPPVALYAVVSGEGLFPPLGMRDSLPFWLARTLTSPMTVVIDAKREAEIRHWCKLLQRMLIAGRPALSSNTLPLWEGLRDARCEADVEIGSEHGVDAMPWMEWPGCIRNEETIWIWRQSRYGKVIESQKMNRFE
ncbi:hypothetical protein [Serratia sp. UGAL515B_01]|uniref:hypothetical protein n=1 Tax=Serratia sp. UGAL515B_01 TaxID=2986763 RepID=UPI002953B573|nr:hypothetical protein [Serratia sp. UGAL515B_01]WON77490.1 hypothetical protein OK023_01905 [Serratia sp. UGAL515B_01]